MHRPLKIDLKPSAWSVCYLVVVHLAAMLGILLFPLSVPLIIFFLFVLVVSFIYQLGKIILSVEQIQSLVLRESKCQVRLKNSRRYTGVLSKQNFVSHYLVVLSLEVSGQWLKQPVLVWRDALDEDLFRQLKVRLRYPVGEGAN